MMVRLWVCVFMAVVLAVLHAAQPAAADKRHNSPTTLAEALALAERLDAGTKGADAAVPTVYIFGGYQVG